MSFIQVLYRWGVASLINCLVHPFNDSVLGMFLYVTQICVLWEHTNNQPLFGVYDLEAFDFHEEITLSHVNGIFFDNVPDVYIGAYGHHQLEDLRSVTSYPLGEIGDFVVAGFGRFICR